MVITWCKYNHYRGLHSVWVHTCIYAHSGYTHTHNTSTYAHTHTTLVHMHTHTHTHTDKDFSPENVISSETSIKN